jgi:hypothetical protein
MFVHILLFLVLYFVFKQTFLFLVLGGVFLIGLLFVVLKSLNVGTTEIPFISSISFLASYLTSFIIMLFSFLK